MSGAPPNGAPKAAPEAPSPELLASNLEALGRRFPGLAELVAAAPAQGLELARSATGDMSAKIAGGHWLHSSRDPRAEARRLVAAARRSGEDTAVILGFGLGYLAEALLGYKALAAEGLGAEGAATASCNMAHASGGSGRSFERAIACEADPGALKAAFGARDLRALLADDSLGFVVGGEPELIVSALELSGGERAAILELKAAEASDPAWFARARSAAERWNAKGAVNASTLRRFGRLWVRNLARNLGTAATAAGVDRLEGLFAGVANASPIPALVLAAGPSLDLVLPRVAEASRRALIICVDTALRSLLRFGIEPDFLVVVDPQYWNWRHVAGLTAERSFLVSEMAAWPALFRATRRGTFLGGSLFPLGRRIESFAGRRGMLGAGGSVATSAWDLGRIMGCSPLWMAGLDLGYPEGQTHARASLFEQRALSAAHRLEPVSSAQASALVGGTSFTALAADGGVLRTDQRMCLYAWWFESRLARPGSPLTRSLSPGGLAVPGLLLASLDELLSGPDIRLDIEARLDLAQAFAREAEARRDGARMAEGLDRLRAQLESIARTAERARAAACEGRSAFVEGRDCKDSLDLLARADEEILGVQARDVAGFLLPPLNEISARPARDLGESLAQSEALYASLAESARYHLSAFEDA